MAKIGIYIPAEKEGEIKKWEKHLNFSQIFREGFDRAVRKAELSTMGETEMDKVVARLKQDQDLDYQAGKESGYEGGIEWAKEDASLADLRRVQDAENFQSADDLLELRENDDYWLELLEKTIEQEGRDRDSYLAGYAEGFQSGAGSIWSEIRYKFET